MSHTSTDAIGALICDFIQDRAVDPGDGTLEQDWEGVIAIDDTDQSNLTVVLSNGQRFTIRIFADN